MKRKFTMSDTEREVLEVLWEQKEPMKQSGLLAIFAEKGKVWKRQTLNTFLARLEEKKLVVRENRKVRAAFSEEEYQCEQMKDAIDRMYGGKLSNFVVAFAENDAISKEDAEELLHIMQQKVLEMESGKEKK
ncbi:MAG: BlaI/MecI/CopY family transcriptional regulator [Lachnospiraceae bacterium]|nr:BlaI/MecI/CopY family transcriptional regulator [Lachnospiraceae bacterium]